MGDKALKLAASLFSKRDTHVKTLTTYSQAFLAFSFLAGAKLVSAQIDVNGFCIYQLDDADGVATKALNRWLADEVLVNAKIYASNFRKVKRITTACRNTAKIQKNEVENDHSAAVTIC